MGYLDRAKSMHERGEPVRAAVILAEGLKREPDNAEALEWLLHLYVEELANPGIERELLTILELQPNGRELFQIVEAELREVGRESKIEALHEMRIRHGFLETEPAPQLHDPEPYTDRYVEPDDPGPQDLAPPPREPYIEAARSGGGRDHWEDFENPLEDASARPPIDESEAVRALREEFGDRFEDDLIDSSTRDQYAQRPRWLAIGGVTVLAIVAAVFLITANQKARPVPTAPAGSGEGSGAVMREMPGGEGEAAVAGENAPASGSGEAGAE